MFFLFYLLLKAGLQRTANENWELKGSRSTNADDWGIELRRRRSVIAKSPSLQIEVNSGLPCVRWLNFMELARITDRARVCASAT